MLQITVPGQELFDEKTNSFYVTKTHVLQLEHSLISVSKWEARWKKPFLGSDKKTSEEIRDYIRCMTLNKDVDPFVYSCLTYENEKAISDYINDPMTATTFREDGKRSREIITSELIYYWMIALNIPESYQKWHLNRLMTLIRVCNIKNTPPKKMSQRDIMAQNRALNQARRSAGHTRG